ncbi:UNVERIFIED_ORG: lipoprotein-anchoring transpeptidase ErfK/SrfK [Ensifer adhaerens]|nr:lipoprotein-anchoring transpeptidase ErfK/SrfK [Ensifer adhaerens]
MRHTSLIVVIAVLMQFSVQPLNAANLVAKISLSSQTMVVKQNGVVMYRWKVSTARKGYVTPKGSWKAKWLSRNHRSKKYDDTPMPYAVFFNGGYAVHATYDVKRLGRPASHGCVRLHPNNAAEFFALAREHGLKNTRIVITR